MLFNNSKLILRFRTKSSESTITRRSSLPLYNSVGLIFIIFSINSNSLHADNESFGKSRTNKSPFFQHAKPHFFLIAL